MDILEANGMEIPENIKEADVLTQYSVQLRYPSWVEGVTAEEYRLAFWAEGLIK
jgi:hypothetical protein